MNEQAISNNTKGGAAFEHAVVIGSSIAGMTAARILTEHFSRVTIIDRDYLPDTPDFRQGVPQARHAHTLPLRGQALLEQLFPGLVAELVANGAISIKPESEMAFFIAGSWHQLRGHAGNVFLACSRPVIDAIITRRLAGHPGVQMIQGHEAMGLEVDRQGRRVSGVRLRQRRGPASAETYLAADLVVDASGRNSQAPRWLAELGYQPPRESKVDAQVGYATRIYRRPEGFAATWKTMYIKPSPPDGTRGGILIPLEGDRWHVSLVGIAGDYPPIDEEGFLAFARSLPASQLYEAIQEAEPLAKPYGYRRTDSRVRHYDQLPSYLEGLLVSGDAAYTLNPLYVQGMTTAALGSLALDASLKAQRQQAVGDLTGLAGTFQRKLSQALAETWRMVTSHDLRWPATQIIETPDYYSLPAAKLTFKPEPVSYRPAYAQ